MNYLRLKRKKDITKILKSGKRAHATSLTLVYFPAKQTAMAVCVGKKYGKSTVRNKIKRLLREAFRVQGELTHPCELLLIPRVAEEYSYHEFVRDIAKLLKKERLIEDQHPKTADAELQVSAEEGF